MISSIIQVFVKIQPNMSEQVKKRQRIYDLFNAETKPKKIFLFGLHQTQTFNPPLDYAIWGVLENKTNATSHLYIGSLRSLLRRDGIKCLKNVF